MPTEAQEGEYHLENGGVYTMKIAEGETAPIWHGNLLCAIRRKNIFSDEQTGIPQPCPGLEVPYKFLVEVLQ